VGVGTPEMKFMDMLLDRRNQLNLKVKIMHWLLGNQHYQQKANSSYKNQYSNPSGLRAFSYGG
jgi:hypothetical protein